MIEGTSSTSGESIPWEKFLSEMARAICENTVPCCREAGYTTDVATCEKRWMFKAESSVVAPGTTDVAYDGTAAAECIDLIRQDASTCGAVVPDTLTDACTRVFVGVRQPGEPCEHASQCSKPLGAWAECNSLASGGPDACIVDVRGRSGDPCTWTCVDHDPLAYDPFVVVCESSLSPTTWSPTSAELLQKRRSLLQHRGDMQHARPDWIGV